MNFHVQRQYFWREQSWTRYQFNFLIDFERRTCRVEEHHEAWLLADLGTQLPALVCEGPTLDLIPRFTPAIAAFILQIRKYRYNW